MKIGLDGQKLLIDKLAGPEVYTFNTFQAFAKVDKANEYIVYFDREPNDEFWNSLSLENPNFSYKVVSSGLSWTQSSLAIQLFKDRPDVFFNAKHTVPVLHPRKTKLVSMIHGLEFKINKQFFKNPIKGIIHPLVLWWVLRFSEKIIVPSKHTLNSIENKKWPFIDLDKMTVIPEGVKKSFHKRPEQEVQEMRDKYKIGENPYLIFVSTIQPRKNIPRMVHAFSNVVKNYDKYSNLKLLISGKLGWLYKESLEAPGKYEVAENMRFLGRTPDEDLPKLLSGAKAFISCSLEEGFGIPLLEAMACETPTIVSDIPAFKELGQDTPVYVNPEKIESIEQGILELLNRDAGEPVADAKKLAGEYTWEKGAKKIISVFVSTVEGN